MDEFEKWWLAQCTKGYFVHNYENDKELMRAVWDAATENQRLRESNASFDDGKCRSLGYCPDCGTTFK